MDMSLFTRKIVVRIFCLVVPFALAPLLLSADNPTVRNFNARLTKVEQELKNKKCYNPIAGAKAVEGYHLFLIGEFLWWRAEEDGLTFSYKTNNPTGNLTENNIRLEEIHFDWDYGYRVGGGVNFPHDRWDLCFYWTHLNTQAKRHKEVEGGEGLFPYWAFPSGVAGGDFFPKAKAHWKLFLNMGDAELGKEYFVGKKVSMRPFLSARTAWTDQEYKIEYEEAPLPLGETLDDSIHMQCTYWGLGPRIGVDMQWWLTKTFNIYGMAAISLLYGDFHVKQKEEIEIVEEQPLHFKDSFHIARPIADIGIGLGWDTLFFDDRLHIGLTIGWEQHVFFDQNQFIRFVSGPTTSVLSNRGDLSLEGLTASLRLDF